MLEILAAIVFGGLFVLCVWQIGADLDEGIKEWRDGQDKH